MQSPHGEAPDGNTGKETSWREAIMVPVHRRNAGVKRGTTDWTQHRTTAKRKKMRHWAVLQNNTEYIENRKKQQLCVRNDERRWKVERLGKVGEKLLRHALSQFITCVFLSG